MHKIGKGKKEKNKSKGFPVHVDGFAFASSWRQSPYAQMLRATADLDVSGVYTGGRPPGYADVMRDG
jgi:hypothetical protein